MQSTAPTGTGAPILNSNELIGPTKARIYLRNQAPNRLVNETLVTQYACAMLDSEWSNTGDPIKFDELGRLADGQHRMQAIVESETEQIFSVARGISFDTLLTRVDTGRKRGAADVLTIMSEDPNTDLVFLYPRNLPAVAKLVMTYYKLRDVNRNTLYCSSLSTTQVVQFCVNNKSALEDACREGMRLATHCPMSKASLAACVFLCKQADKDALTSFMDELVRPTSTVGNPAYSLREQAIKDRAKRNPSWSKDARLTAAYFIKAFNAFTVGRTLEIIRFKAFGDQMEEFPTPEGWEQPF